MSMQDHSPTCRVNCEWCDVPRTNTDMTCPDGHEHHFCTCHLWRETGRLHAAVDAFTHAMKAKLDQKALEGRQGWDNPEYGPAIARSLLAHVEKGPGQEVDIANLAMMLWWHSQHDASEAGSKATSAGGTRKVTQLTDEQFKEIRRAIAEYMGADESEVTIMVSGCGDTEQILAEIKADLDELEAEREHIEDETGR